MGQACSRYWKKLNPCKVLVGKSEGKRQLARPRQKWENVLKLIVGK
jgi:hypothetical protein